MNRQNDINKERKYSWYIIRIIWYNIVWNFSTFFFEFVASIGSAISIYSFYFKKGFSLEKKLDYVITAFLLLIIIVYMFRLKAILNRRKLKLKKKLFFEYINRRLNNAKSIINIAGDLSWLAIQYETYTKLKKEERQIKIYYSENSINKPGHRYDTIQKYKDLGVEMIPYPKGFELQSQSIKGMILDYGDDDLKFYSFSKLDEGGNCMQCSQYERSDPEFKIVSSYIHALDENLKAVKKIKEVTLSQGKPENLFLIGVSGLNNIGKTTLCRKLANEYGEEFVELIPDTFIQHSKTSDLPIALFCISTQIALFNKIIIDNPSKRIFIFDRTPIDNFAFLQVHKNLLKKQQRSQLNTKKTSYRYQISWENYVTILESEIERFMKRFSLIALLIPDIRNNWINENNRTSAISDEVRSETLKEVNRLYKKMLSDDKIKIYKMQKYDFTNLEQYEIDRKISDNISSIIEELKRNIDRSIDHKLNH